MAHGDHRDLTSEVHALLEHTWHTLETLERAGGQTLDFPDLADRVSDDLFGRRLAIAKAARDLPLGNRAELTRWRHACARMFARILHDPANALRSA